MNFYKRPLMPRSTALWFVDNTTLTFQQIADFCNLHILEIQAIADGDVSTGIFYFNPIEQEQVSKEDIRNCELDHSKRLTLLKVNNSLKISRANKYTPLSKRSSKPDAVLWILKNYPQIPDNKICKLLGTTRAMIHSIRNKTHWNIKKIRSQSPIFLSLCTQSDLDECLKT